MILDAELVCFTCGQKIKLAHLKCQKEKRQKQIQDILDDLIFDGECYKMSIKTYRQWEARRK
ncbi:hypothetical protein LCGC14_1917930 [marine sediment metagenome]|uniref:Uncharacterized protein n=1 Tax=marine sediment metagenome TaxID=412755 RepID=A0A0F9GEZ1_9ZZZZ